MKYLLIILILYVVPALGQAQYPWDRIHVVNYSNVEVLAEAGNGIVLAESNGIYRSTDRGLTWVEVLHTGWSPQVDSLGRFYCLDQSGIQRSIDGGQSFQRIAEWPFSSGHHFLVNGAGSFFVQSNGVLLRSTNEGSSWDTVVRRVYSQPKLGVNGLLGIQRRIQTSSPDGISVSSDGGSNWLELYTGSNTNFGFSSNGAIIVSRLDGAIRTFDLGITWDTLMYPDFPRGKTTAIHSALDNTYAIIADTLWHSTDDGTQWSPIVRANSLFRTAGSAWMVLGTCLYRIDGDTLVPSNVGFFGLFVKRVFTFGSDTLIANQPYGVVRGTENAHRPVPPDSPQGLGYAHRFDYWRDTLYASGNDVMFSTDTGRSWARHPLRFVSGIDSSGRFHEARGYTTNKGLNYESYNCPLFAYNDVKILPNSAWLIVGNDSGCISQDEGKTWRVFVHSNTPSSRGSVTPLDDSVWIVHRESAISMTEDAGVNWMQFTGDSSHWGRPTTDGRGNHVIAYNGKWLQQWNPNLKSWVAFDSSPYHSISSVDYRPSGRLFIGTVWHGLYVRDYPSPIARLDVQGFLNAERSTPGYSLASKSVVIDEPTVHRVEIYDSMGRLLHRADRAQLRDKLDLSSLASQVLYLKLTHTNGTTSISRVYLP